jgi:hypothetical protein
MKLKHTYFSAGEFCCTAYQINRFTKEKEAYFFDWLVTRNTSFSFLVKKDLGEFLTPDNWQIIDNGLRVLDTTSGLAFQHEFETYQEQPTVVDPEKINSHLNQARDKFKYLKEKTLLAMSNAPSPVIIRSENGIKTKQQAESRLSEMRQLFHPINSKTILALTSTQLTEEIYLPNMISFKVNNPSNVEPKDYWKGDDASWDRLFFYIEGIS